MPDLKFNVEDKIIQGDKVVLRLAFTGTYTKILWPATLQPSAFNPPRKIHSEEILIFDVKEGKISEIWEMYNEPEMRLLMGSVWRAMTNSPASTAPSPVRPAPAQRAPDSPPSNP